MSEGKIITFFLLNNDWMVFTDQKDRDKNTPVSVFSQRTGFEFELPASYNQWISMESVENGLQLILKDDQNTKDNALNCFESDWRAVLERYLFASEDSFLPDIALEVGPEKTLFHVHKFILALGCDVFKAMFYGPLAEKGEKVCIPDVSPAGFKIVLRYFYGALIHLTDEDEAMNTWIVADKYCVEELKEECGNFFRCCPITGKNIWKLYETALFFNLEQLIDCCKKFMRRYTETSLCGEGFLNAKLETIQELFNLPVIRVSELFLMESLVHWGMNQVQIGVALSLRDALKPLLPHFRFGALTPEEFCRFLDNSADLLDTSDALDILKHVTKPCTCPLPEWCSGMKWSRADNLSERSFTQYQCINKYIGHKKEKTKKLERQLEMNLRKIKFSHFFV
ncbi:BTB/POZ domain-containing protein 3-like isoform X2 [Argiope bruennichi]|nr:BTB/POZ domain-containing protein 3-like isoform X2 [Argiope bruennichi]